MGSRREEVVVVVDLGNRVFGEVPTAELRPEAQFGLKSLDPCA